MDQEQMAFDWGQPSGEPPSPSLLPRAAALADRLGELAREGIYLGTSSWKYPGWVGQVYQPARYQFRGKFSQKRFDEKCLTEYATIFPTVGGDFSFYQFPSPEAWKEIFDQVPDGFRFSLKVPEEVTVERFPDLPRYGKRAGKTNPNFMNASILQDKLLGPLEDYRSKLGVLILEFGTFHDDSFREGKVFTAALDRMLSSVPTERFSLAVEIRNPTFLDPGAGYLDCLKSRGVAHCLNSWTRMPSLAEQLDIPGIFTAKHVAARLLLKPGRSYEQAVKKFAPYERAQEPNADGRAALRRLIERCRRDKQMLFAFVNNRFEGNAVETIETVVTASA